MIWWRLYLLFATTVSFFLLVSSFQLTPIFSKRCIHINNGRCVGNINIVHRHRAGILQSSKTGKVNGSSIGYEHITNDDISSANNRNATKANAKKYNTTKVDEFDKRIHFTQSKRAAESPVFLFPWSLWMKRIRSAAYHNNEVDTRSENSITTKQKPKRRWEIPLTSRPFQGVEDLRSTVVRCIVAIVIYFIIGTVAFPLWLERKLHTVGIRDTSYAHYSL